MLVSWLSFTCSLYILGNNPLWYVFFKYFLPVLGLHSELIFQAIYSIIIWFQISRTSWTKNSCLLLGDMGFPGTHGNQAIGRDWIEIRKPSAKSDSPISFSLCLSLFSVSAKQPGWFSIYGHFTYLQIISCLKLFFLFILREKNHKWGGAERKGEREF